MTEGVGVLCTFMWQLSIATHSTVDQKRGMVQKLVQSVLHFILGRTWYLDTQEYTDPKLNTLRTACTWLLFIEFQRCVSNLHRNLPMQLFRSFQIIAPHFPTPIFTDLDSLCRLQLLQIGGKFYQQDLWDCSSLVSVAKCPWPATRTHWLPTSFWICKVKLFFHIVQSLPCLHCSCSQDH